MSRAAVGARVFAVYVFAVSVVLIVAPNLLLSLFGIAPTSEVWIRVAGTLAFNIGIYVWVSAHSRPFLEASVYTRTFAFAAFTSFALLGLVSPVLILFAMVDLLGAAWTLFALRADARAGVTGLAGQH